MNAEALASAFDGDDLSMNLATASATEARPLARSLEPDVAVLELEVAVGLRLVRDLLCDHPALTVFIYGSEGDPRELAAWAEAGVTRIVMQSVPLPDFVRSVREAVRGDRPRDRAGATVQRLAGLTSLVRDPRTTYAELTQREHDVLELIGLGLSNREVARTLSLELPTVKNHVQHLMRKLGVHRREDAVRCLSDSLLGHGLRRGHVAKQPAEVGLEHQVDEFAESAD